jgi:hypothetical protein
MNVNLIFSARLLLVISVVACSQRFVAAGEVTLENESLTVAFDSASGALTRWEDKSTHWTIERRSELGDSFRMFAPLPERRYNPILGEKQHASEVKKISDNELRLQWKDLASENGGVLPITFNVDVTLTNAAIVFNGELINDSPLTVETVDYPYFGDFNTPSRDSRLELCLGRDGKTTSEARDQIYPHFANEKGYWGVFFPLKTREAQPFPFCLIQAPEEGVYVGVGSGTVPYRIQYTFEQHPGVVSSVNTLVPEEDEIGGTPVHLEVRTCHFLFTAPHSKAKLAPIVVQCYRGDRKAGADIDKQWHTVPVSDPSK